MDDILYYSPVFLTIVFAITAVLSLICVISVFQTTKDIPDTKDFTKTDLNNKTQRKAKHSFELNVLIMIISTIVIIFFIFLVKKLGLFGRLVSVLLMAKYMLMMLSGVVEGIDAVHKEIGQRISKNLTFSGKAMLLFTLMGIDGLIFQLEDNAIELVSKSVENTDVNDIYIVFAVFIWYYYLAFHLLCITGIAIEIISTIIAKNVCVEKLQFHKKVLLEKYDYAALIIKSCNKIKSLKWLLLRLFCYLVVVPIVFIISVMFCSFVFLIVLLEELVQYISTIGQYMMKAIRLVYRTIRERGDKQYVWFCFRFSIIIAITVSVIIFNYNRVIKESTLRIFMFIAEAIVVPLVITELLRIKEVFREPLVDNVLKSNS